MTTNTTVYQKLAQTGLRMSWTALYMSDTVYMIPSIDEVLVATELFSKDDFEDYETTKAEVKTGLGHYHYSINLHLLLAACRYEIGKTCRENKDYSDSGEFEMSCGNVVLEEARIVVAKATIELLPEEAKDQGIWEFIEAERIIDENPPEFVPSDDEGYHAFVESASQEYEQVSKEMDREELLEQQRAAEEF